MCGSRLSLDRSKRILREVSRLDLDLSGVDIGVVVGVEYIDVGSVIFCVIFG